MSRRNRTNEPPLPRLVVGVAVVAIGAIVSMHRARGTDLTPLYEWWPVALIAVGLAQLPYRRWVAAAVWMVGGTWFLMRTMEVSRVYVSDILGLWPLMISFAGAMLIMHAMRPGERSFSATA